MGVPPWKAALSRALHRNRSQVQSRYLQLATVRETGQPANRTVVFRGFRADHHQLQFVTDTRSDKIGQIAHQPWGEACWYFWKTREQFRLLGDLTLVGVDSAAPPLVKARQQMWQQLSDSARQQFVWPAPGQPRADAAAFSSSPPSAENPVDWFCLLLLDPLQVDHLELRGEPQNRQIYRLKENEWCVEAVNP